jgi:hypothetical protein
VRFAVTLAVCRKIFGYVVGLLWPYLTIMSHETGVHDSMHDVIANTIGTVVVGCMGCGYAPCGRLSFRIDAVRRSMHRHARHFRLPVRRMGDPA